MSMNHAILGMLSHEAMTGYDLKKRMQRSLLMPWSGNNNQIYKALLELAEHSFVTSETLHREGAPSKKVYTITPAGRAELRRWAGTAPEAFGARKTFLLQLAWAEDLSDEELIALLVQYEREIEIQMLMAQKEPATRQLGQAKTPRTRRVWALIDENMTAMYRAELAWIHKVKSVLGSRKYEAEGQGE